MNKANYTFTTKNGEQLAISEKSYAEAFRKFWTFFKELDLIKTIESVETAEIRTSDNEFFIAKNGQKKKNIPLTASTWIYGHLTPKAMEKTYDKFIKAWNGEITAPVDDITAMPETNDDLSEAHAEIDQIVQEMENEETEQVEAQLDTVVNEILTKSDEEIAKDVLAQEEYGVNFEDLVPTQKGKITKKYNKMQQQEA